MTYDIETFSDQRQRESVVLELLNSVVKTGSNLLDETQQYSWMDLSFEDQMRVATSLLTGLEDNAFLLADTIAAERNVVQKVKNIRKCLNNNGYTCSLKLFKFLMNILKNFPMKTLFFLWFQFYLFECWKHVIL